MGMMMPDGQRGDGRGNGPMPGNADRADPGGRDPLGTVQPGQLHRQRRRGGAGGAGAAAHPGDPGGAAAARRGQERPRQELDYIDRLLKQF